MSSKQPQLPPSNWEDRVVHASPPPPPRKVRISKFVKLEEHQAMAAACLEKQCKIVQLEAERDKLREQLEQQRHTADICAHVIVESNFPDDNYCKCEACREVGRRMDEAGFMEHVKDRWWEATDPTD